MDCIRKTVFDAKLYLHIIKIEKQMLRKHAGQSGIPCSAYGSLERDAKPMTRGEMYMKKFVVAILAMAMLLVTMKSTGRRDRKAMAWRLLRTAQRTSNVPSRETSILWTLRQ